MHYKRWTDFCIYNVNVFIKRNLRIRITQKIEIVCNFFLISCWKALLAQNIYLKYKFILGIYKKNGKK